MLRLTTECRNDPPSDHGREKPIWLGRAQRAGRMRQRSLQLRVFGFGLLQDRDAGIRVFPEREEILVSSFSLGFLPRPRSMLALTAGELPRRLDRSRREQDCEGSFEIPLPPRNRVVPPKSLTHERTPDTDFRKSQTNCLVYPVRKDLRFVRDRWRRRSCLRGARTMPEVSAGK